MLDQCERHIRQCRFEFVLIQMPDLERCAELHLIAGEAVGSMKQVSCVQLQQFPEECSLAGGGLEVDFPDLDLD